MANPALLTTVEVAERLGRTRYSIARYVREGTLRPEMRLPGVTGALLFDPAEVDRFAASLNTEVQG